MRKRTTPRPTKAFPANDPQGMGALCNAYMEWGRVHNFSDHTIDHAHRYLGAFIQWAEARGLTKPGEITKPILERYQRWSAEARSNPIPCFPGMHQALVRLTSMPRQQDHPGCSGRS